MPATSKPSSTHATPTIPEIDQNCLPASVTIEFSASDLEVRIRPEIYSPCGGRKSNHVDTLKCELSGTPFTAVTGQLVFSINACNNALDGYLSPETVAKGETYIQDRLRHKALMQRDTAKWALEEAVRLEAAATLPVTFLLPDVG